MKINEIFESIQGEGAYAGYPSMFIRLSGCSRMCDYCDTKYHKNGKEYNINDVIEKIKNGNSHMIVWTGGEPTLQISEIEKVIEKTNMKAHHLETNGDIIIDYNLFNYVALSPKDKNAIPAIMELIRTSTSYDIKVVTDGKLNENLIKYATILMPLTTKNEKKDNLIEKIVWNLSIETKKRFGLRQHIKVWGSQKGK